jgi:hypothetical protein
MLGILGVLGILVWGVLGMLGGMRDMAAPAPEPWDGRGADGAVINPRLAEVRLFGPPSISAERYRAVLQRTQHPAALEADALYALVCAAGMDPAIHAALALLDLSTGDPITFPPPRGGFNLHRLQDPATGRMLTFPTYAAAVHAWIDYVRVVTPATPQAPATLDGLIAASCPPPSCPTAALQREVRRRVQEVRSAGAAPRGGAAPDGHGTARGRGAARPAGRRRAARPWDEGMRGT